MYGRYTIMLITGEIVIHKTDNATRACAGVKVLPDGSIAVWDQLPGDDYKWDGDKLILLGDYNEGTRGRILEPDVIAGADQFDRVERKGHSWKMSNIAHLRELAEKRDDVDPDELPDKI